MENGTKRREWVKNAIIIFLVVMLLLTFFSNTERPERRSYDKRGSQERDEKETENAVIS